MFTVSHLKFKRPFTLLASVAAFLSLILSLNTLQAEDILLLRSYDFLAYNEAIGGFREEWRKDPRYVLETLDLKGNLREGHDAIRRFKKEHGQPAAILAVGVLAASLAKDEFESVPIIFCMVVNYERYELDAPNIAGISLEVYTEEQFKSFKEVIRDLKNIGVLYDPNKSEGIIEKGREVAKKLGLNLITSEVREEEEVPKVLKKLIGKIDALWLIPDTTVVSARTTELITRISLEKGVPLLCTSETLVRVGALAGVFADNKSIGKQAARLVKEILKSPSPTPIGVEYPKEVRLAVNKDVAKLLNIDTGRLVDRPSIVFYP